MSRIEIVKDLDDILRAFRELEPGNTVPDEGLERLREVAPELSATLCALNESRNEFYRRYRTTLSGLLADSDRLSEVVARIGLGRFDVEVAAVDTPALKPVCIGIQDMQAQLQRSQDEVNRLVDHLRASEERFRQLVESSSDWIWEVDDAARYRYASPQVESILGYKPEEVLGRKLFDFMPEEEKRRVSNIFSSLVRGEKPIAQLANVNLHKNGSEVTLETSGSPFFNEHGELMGYRGVGRDITERMKMEDALRHLATHDGLTGLSNRQVFQDRILNETQRAQRYGHSLSLIMLDIDFFKAVNDQYGHSAGDGILRDIAKILKDSARQSDCVARYGGEEFVTLLPETDPAEAMRYAERLCESINGTAFHINHDHQLKITVSIGVASLPENASACQELIDRADEAMYAAKASGRNRVCRAKNA